MIRYSDNNDRERIISVWSEVFGDSRKEVEFFLDNKYIPQNTLIKEINDEIVAMLFLLDGKMHIKNEDYPAYYLYAACTQPKYRGRGYMAQLLEFAKQTALKRNFCYIALLPASESLYGYYSRHGYKPIFKKKITEITPNELQKAVESDLKSVFNGGSANFAGSCRSEETDYFKWDNESIKYAKKHTEFFGGKVVESCNGYLLYTINDDVLTVKENTFTEKEMLKMLYEAVKLNNLSRIQISSPTSYEFGIGKEYIRKSGMLLPITAQAQINCGKVENAYLGLTLD